MGLSVQVQCGGVVVWWDMTGTQLASRMASGRNGSEPDGGKIKSLLYCYWVLETEYSASVFLYI